MATDPLAAARLPRRLPELRRAGRVPLGRVAVRGLQLLPLARSCAPATRCARSARAPSSSTTTRRCSSAPPAATRARAFTLVGRLQYRYADGTWNEWHALFESGPSAEVGLALATTTAATSSPSTRRCRRAVPPPENLRPGAPLTVNGAELVGRLGRRRQADRRAGRAAAPAEPRAAASSSPTCAARAARSARSTTPSRRGRRWSVGRSVALAELAMTGLREASEKTLSGRTLQCPSCGAALEVKLETTQSIVCHQCKAVVDVSQGVGGDLAHYAQDNGSEPQIPLGTVGTLALGGKAALPWQVVGYVERCEIAGERRRRADLLARVPALPPHRGLRLPRRRRGRLELGDRRSPARRRSSGDSVKHEGVLYRKLYDYTGQVTYVLGEFYWRLTRDQRTANTDYAGTGAASAKRLNRERPRARARRRSSGRPARRSRPTRCSRPSGSATTSARRCSATPADELRQRARSSPRSSSGASCCSSSLMLFRCGDDSGKRRLRPGAQHLRRGVAGVPELPQQPAQRRRLPQRRRLVRRLFQRRRPQVAAAPSSSGLFRTGGSPMIGLEWLKPAVIFGSILYALIGVVDLLDLLRHRRQDHALRPVGGDRREEERRAGDRRRRDGIAIGMIVAAAVHG